MAFRLLATVLFSVQLLLQTVAGAHLHGHENAAGHAGALGSRLHFHAGSRAHHDHGGCAHGEPRGHHHDVAGHGEHRVEDIERVNSFDSRYCLTCCCHDADVIVVDAPLGWHRSEGRSVGRHDATASGFLAGEAAIRIQHGPVSPPAAWVRPPGDRMPGVRDRMPHLLRI